MVSSNNPACNGFRSEPFQRYWKCHIAYCNTEIPENALEIVKENERVSQMLGELQPIGKLTILEGYVKYSKNADSVFMALTIKGNKGKGKMDVKAFKKNGEWHYQELDVHLKEPHYRKETIPIALR